MGPTEIFVSIVIGLGSGLIGVFFSSLRQQDEFQQQREMLEKQTALTKSLEEDVYRLTVGMGQRIKMLDRMLENLKQLIKLDMSRTLDGGTCGITLQEMLSSMAQMEELRSIADVLDDKALINSAKEFVEGFNSNTLSREKGHITRGLFVRIYELIGCGYFAF